jgi:N-methylhydantoinase A
MRTLSPSAGPSRPFRIGVDIGGTFTDIVLLASDGRLFSKKLLSTPPDYSEAIETGVAALLRETGVLPGQVGEFFHGTTIATNTIIERKGSRVALVTTRGFRDVLELARYRAPRLYDLTFRKPDPLVERRLRFEAIERMGADGVVVTPVDESSLAEVAQSIDREGIDAVAVCFINAYVNPENEAAAVRYLRTRLPDVSISASSQLLPQIQEYERTSTTVVNAYLRPVVGRYIAALEKRLARIGIEVPLMIMQSSGGALPGRLAAENPIYIIESGPAAGVLGAQRLGQKIGLGDLLVLDMGGTTAKASIIEDGRFGVATETEVGGGAQLGHRLIQGAGYVVQVPTIDIAEVGAGGGSIASVDLAGGLQVGPRSAGAVPGPACYGRGGSLPTVTDANLVLGYISPDNLVGGELQVDPSAARAAIERIAAELRIASTDAAYGVHLIANSNMMRALNGVSSERGRDPSHYRLMAIGGNGAVHACKLAEDLGIERIVVPPVAGLFSALGLMFADVEHQVIRGYYRRLGEIDLAEMNRVVGAMHEEARTLLDSEGFPSTRQHLVTTMEVKYFGQMSTLPIELDELPVTDESLQRHAETFATMHEQTYGYRSPRERLQIVAIKVLGQGVAETPRLPDRVSRDRERRRDETTRSVYFGPEAGWLQTPLLARANLESVPRDGPMVIEEYDCTTVVRPGWSAHIDGWNNIVMERSAR